MSHPNGFLDKDSDELESFLFAHARRELAPEAARAKALLTVASVAVGAGVLSSAAALGARPALGKITTWLAAKWLLVGMGGGLVTIVAAQSVAQLTTPARSEAPESRSVALPRAQPKSNRRAPLALPEPASSTTAEPAESSSPPMAAASPSAPAAAAAPFAPRAADGQASPSDGVPVSASQLTRELSLLDPARAALDAHSGPRALQALDEYAKEFPKGSLRAEASALRVQAVGFGDPAQALRLAQAFLASYPGSPLTARVRALADGYRAYGH